MNCPRDGTRLGVAKVDGCSLEKCPMCEGLWIEREELDRILRLGWHKVERCIRVIAPDDGDTSDPTSGYMRCPKCSEGRLQTVTYTFTRAVKIDRCDSCLGYWLDHSELDAILADKSRLDDYDAQAFALQRSRDARSDSDFDKYSST